MVLHLSLLLPTNKPLQISNGVTRRHSQSSSRLPAWPDEPRLDPLRRVKTGLEFGESRGWVPYRSLGKESRARAMWDRGNILFWAANKCSRTASKERGARVSIDLEVPARSGRHRTKETRNLSPSSPLRRLYLIQCRVATRILASKQTPSQSQIC
jgi:hypothetical protein